MFSMEKSTNNFAVQCTPSAWWEFLPGYSYDHDDFNQKFSSSTQIWSSYFSKDWTVNKDFSAQLSPFVLLNISQMQKARIFDSKIAFY